jgi:hypothetical protein
MNVLMRVLTWPVSRRKVDAATLSSFSELLFSEISVRNFPAIDKLTPVILDRLVTEAYRMAEEKEADHIARYGRFIECIEYIADQVVLAAKRPDEADRLISRILIHNNVLLEGTR